MLRKIKRRRRRWGTKDEMVGWHHRLDGHEFEQAPGDGEGQGSLACCSPWDGEELAMAWRLNTKTRSHRLFPHSTLRVLL